MKPASRAVLKAPLVYAAQFTFTLEKFRALGAAFLAFLLDYIAKELKRMPTDVESMKLAG